MNRNSTHTVHSDSSSISLRSMTETCKRYEAEAKWRTPYKQMADTTKATAILLAPNVSAFFSDLTTSPFKTMKRKSGDSLNVEETKKSKSSELNWIFGENGKLMETKNEFFLNVIAQIPYETILFTLNFAPIFLSFVFNFS